MGRDPEGNQVSLGQAGRAVCSLLSWMGWDWDGAALRVTPVLQEEAAVSTKPRIVGNCPLLPLPNEQRGRL